MRLLRQRQRHPPGHVARSQRYVTVLLTFVCTSVCYIERVGFSVAYTAAATEAGVGEAVKGRILSSFFYGHVLSQVPGGWAAQRFGGRRVLLTSFALWSLTSALTPTEADAVPAMVAARFLVGVAQGFIFPSFSYPSFFWSAFIWFTAQAKVVETPILGDAPPWLVSFFRENMGFVKMEKVVAAAFSLLDDESKAGECMWVPVNRPTQIWPDEETKSKYQILMKDGSNYTGVFN